MKAQGVPPARPQRNGISPPVNTATWNPPPHVQPALPRHPSLMSHPFMCHCNLLVRVAHHKCVMAEGTQLQAEPHHAPFRCCSGDFHVDTHSLQNLRKEPLDCEMLRRCAPAAALKTRPCENTAVNLDLAKERAQRGDYGWMPTHHHLCTGSTTRKSEPPPAFHPPAWARLEYQQASSAAQ